MTNTRKFAKRQEQTLAQILNGKRQANSGAKCYIDKFSNRV